MEAVPIATLRSQSAGHGHRRCGGAGCSRDIAWSPGGFYCLGDGSYSSLDFERLTCKFEARF